MYKDWEDPKGYDGQQFSGGYNVIEIYTYVWTACMSSEIV